MRSVNSLPVQKQEASRDESKENLLSYCSFLAPDFFSGFILYKEYTLRTGTEVILKTEPVDPRDLFRGDYVVLNYEISTLDLEEIPVEDPYFEYNDRIYLVLELENGYGVPKKNLQKSSG